MGSHVDGLPMIGTGGLMAAIMNAGGQTRGSPKEEAHCDHPETPERPPRPQSFGGGSVGGQSYDRGLDINPIIN